MKKPLLLFIAIILTTSAMAQLWCTPNSVWHYNTSNPTFSNTYTKHTYLYDTLVGGITFNKIRTEREGEGVSGYIHSHGFFYTSLQGNVVFFNSANNTITATDTLFYFGPVGAKWRCNPNGGTSCSHSFIEITATGTLNIQGQNLEYRKINYTNYNFYGTNSENIQTGTDTIFERMGYKHLAFQFLGYCSDHPDAYPAAFRCFQDNQLNLASTIACNYTTGLNEFYNSDKRFTVYPNPSNGMITLHTKSLLKNTAIEITDVIGKTVLTSQYSDSIDISTLKAGIYYLHLKSDLVNSTAKFIKY